MSALRVEGLGVSAGGRQLLADVAFTVASGEVLALVGRSGLGKSQLLRAIATLDDATPPRAPSTRAGCELTLDDRPPATWGYPAWRRAVLLVQQRGVMLDGTVRANLLRPFSLGVAGPAPPEAELVARLGALNLGPEVLDQPARRLSIGQAQRVSLVRALLVQPRVLLLDEPTAGLDPEATLRVEAAVRDACAAGAAALLVSHDPEQANRMGATVLQLGTFAPLDAEDDHAS